MAELNQNVSPAHTNSSVSHQSTETIALSSQLARAKYKVYIIVCVMSNGFKLIIDRKDISHNQELGVFTVLGTNGNPHAVRLFPSESCTCPSTSQFYHILAVRMSVGLIDQNGKKRINLTQLRRNKRTRKSRCKIP